MRLLTLFVLLLLSYPVKASELDLSRPRPPVAASCYDVKFTEDGEITRHVTNVEIIEDHGESVPDEPTAKLLDQTSTVTEDYETHDFKKGISYRTINAPIKPDSTLLWAGKKIGKGILHFVTHTTRFTLGCLAVQYYGHVANEIVGTAAYSLVLHYTANPWIANAAYHVGKETLAPVTLSILFYVAAHTPDLLYFTIKGTNYSLKLIYEGGRLVLRTGGKVYTTLRDLFNMEKHRDDMIEMLLTDKPSRLFIQEEN